ncbi:hypothetical protein AB0C51_22565 [Streptomyces pathocidini]|uniref:Uncharacterized protein n=1 Tax=Streptomyces pathocidini TaxID=1650571 RepID=A0ABW7USS4_9ACTN|nr:hypothetical protein [Streptomyces pathocidini]
MASQHEPEGWSAAKFTCPACHQPVEAVVKRRRKVLGAYVPVWEPGPCANPECPRSPQAEQDGGPAEEPKEAQPG